MAHLGGPGTTLYSMGPAGFRGRHGHRRVPLTLALGAPLVLGTPASFRIPLTIPLKGIVDSCFDS